MAIQAHVTPTGWLQYDDVAAFARVSPTGWDAGYVPVNPVLYYVIGPASGWTDPTPLQIKNGQLAGGGAATASGNQAGPLEDATVTFINAATGLTSGVSYKLAFVEYDGDLYSNIVVTSFTTVAAFKPYWAMHANLILGAGAIR